jgi:hypothetical protein
VPPKLVSVIAAPLTVRHVRVPLEAVQSLLPTMTALLALVARFSEGAPLALVLPVTPSPPWLRQTLAMKDHCALPRPAVRAMVMVRPVWVAVTSMVYR